MCVDQRQCVGRLAADVALQSETEQMRTNAGGTDVSEQESVSQRGGMRFGVSGYVWRIYNDQKHYLSHNNDQYFPIQYSPPASACASAIRWPVNACNSPPPGSSRAAIQKPGPGVPSSASASPPPTSRPLHPSTANRTASVARSPCTNRPPPVSIRPQPSGYVGAPTRRAHRCRAR